MTALNSKSSRLARFGHLKLTRAEAWSENLMVGQNRRRGAKSFKRSNLGLILGLVILVGMAFLGQLFRLQVVNGARYENLANGNRLRQTITYAPRGRIYDRAGVLLASNTASFQLVAFGFELPRSNTEREVAYRTIAHLSGLSASRVKARAESKGLDSIAPVLVADKIIYTRALVLEQRLPRLSGFSLDSIPVRKYVTKGALAAVLGYTGRASEFDLSRHSDLSPIDFVGKDGIEAEYDDLLRGQDGLVETEVDAAGRPLRVLRELPAVPGQDIRLTIDYGVQKVFANALAVQMRLAHVRRAAGTAVDPRTGAVIAMVSLPSFDNNLFADGISESAFQRLVSNPDQPLVNKVIGGNYPSGSIIKPFHLAGALQEGVVNEHTVIVDTGRLVIKSDYNPAVSYIFNGWNPAGLGPMTAERAIAMSSDIYFYTVGGGYGNFIGMGAERLDKYYGLFGLGAASGIDLPGEAAGLVPSPEWKKRVLGQDWVLGDTYHIAIGQGDLLVSPLQMALATATLANDGKLMKPYVFDSTTDGAVATKPDIIRQNFINQANLKIVQAGMRMVITNGLTGPQTFAAVPVPVAGKSGTAETDVDKRVPHAWYEAYAPYPNPTVAFAVILEQGFNGSRYAAPAIAAAMQYYFTRQGGAVGVGVGY